MNVSLRPLEDGDLDTIYQQVTDPESIRMAAFTAEDQTDRSAFLNRMSRVRADTNASNRVIDVDGAMAGTIASFRIDNRLEVTYWVDRTQWGKGIASAALQILLAETAERPVYARAASDNVGSLRVLEKAGFRRKLNILGRRLTRVVSPRPVYGDALASFRNTGAGDRPPFRWARPIARA